MIDKENVENFMFSFFKMTPDLVCIAGKDGYLKKVNPAVNTKLGYTNEELYSRPIQTFIHPDDIELTRQRRAALIAGEALLNFQNRYIAKSGDVLWLEWTSIYLPDKELVFAIAKDITERKQREFEIEAKFKITEVLAQHFKSHLEEDRKNFAFELNGELAQMVAAIKMNISWMRLNARGMSEEQNKRMDELLVITDLFINTVRRISFEISPNMLEDFGLNATIEWVCKEFSALNPIQCVFNSNCNEEDIPGHLKTDFFRICQEALADISQHANAEVVTITIENIDATISLTITDDGKEPGSWIKKSKSGITKIQQRAISLNSELLISSNELMGTKVSVSVVN